MSSSKPYLTFRVGAQWYAVDIAVVFEVANMVAIAAVPDMPKAILGMVNIRGSVVPVLDLRIRFNTPNQTLELTTPIVFLHHEQTGTYGIVVDDIDDVINLSDEVIAPSALSQRAKHIIGMTDYEGRLIMILDPAQLMISSLEDQSLDEFIQQVQKA